MTDRAVRRIPDPLLNTRADDQQIRITATDPSGARATQTLTLDINDGPAESTTNPIPDLTVIANRPIAPVNLASHFADPDGNTLEFTAPDLPGGLVHDKSTNTIGGIPTTVGTTTVTITATDPDNAAATATFTITRQTEQTEQTVDIDVSRGFRGPNKDNDNDPLTYTATVIRSGQSTVPIDSIGLTLSNSGRITGTLTARLDAPVLLITATDSGGNTAFQPLTLDANEDPVALPATRTETTGISVDIDTAKDFNDPDGATATQTLTLEVNDGPAASAPIPDFTSAVNRYFDSIRLNDYFTDPDGDPLAITATGLPDGLALHASTIVSSHPYPTAAGTFTVTVTAEDPHGLDATATFTITVIKHPPGRCQVRPHPTDRRRHRHQCQARLRRPELRPPDIHRHGP